MKIGFDNELYVRKQMEHILEHMNKFDNKLYIEFGGKLFDDHLHHEYFRDFSPIVN